jgi:hypothetical protein
MIQFVYKLVLMDWKKWMKIIKLIWRNKLDNNEWKENDLPVANWCNKTSRCIDYDAVFYNKLNSVA